MTKTGDICEQCGKTRSDVASITQWIVLGDRCSCDSKPISTGAKSFQPDVSSSCPRCGGSLSKHEGSLTQWIFRSSQCKCDQIGNTETASIAVLEELPVADLDEQAIEVDEGRFPSNRYTPLSIIDSGQQGHVYKARDRQLNRLVCIKVLRTTTKLEPEQAIRFQREAKTGGKLMHPNIVKVLDFGLTEAGQPFLVMELCAGDSMHAMIEEQGPLGVDLALSIFIRVCRGVQYAHEHGVLHRDLKTSNVLVSKDREVKIIDFGLSGLLDTTDGDGKLTTQGVIMGSPAFMSPEQIQRNQPLDERTDVYSLGCMLFQTLTGKMVFEGESALEVLNSQVHSPPPTLSDSAPELDFPDALEQIVQKSLEKVPADRFQTVADFQGALEDLYAVEDEPEDSPVLPEPVMTSIDPSTRNSRSMLAVKAIVMTLLLLGTIGIASTISSIFENSAPTRSCKFDVHKIGESTWLIASGGFHGKNADQLLKLYDSKYVKIIDPSLSDDDLKNLAHLPIEFLDLSGTKITNNGLKTIANIDSLEGLILNNDPGITDDGLKEIEQLPHLKILALGDTSVTDRGVRSISEMRKLNSIDLSGLKNVTKDSLVALSKLPDLFSLRVGKTGIKPEDIVLLQDLTSLKLLSVSELGLEDRDMPNIRRLKVAVLDISRNPKITDSGMKVLSPLSYWYLKYHGCTGLSEELIDKIETAREKIPALIVSIDLAAMDMDVIDDGQFDPHVMITFYNPKVQHRKFLDDMQKMLPSH